MGTQTRWPIVQSDRDTLRRVSVSPWCDQRYMAEQFGPDHIFCRKPNPTLISCAVWDEQAIRDDLADTMQAAGNCVLEFAMKDVHTLADQPWRLRCWVEIARQGTEGAR